MTVTRDEAFCRMQQHIQTANLRNHCLAVEAVMRGLAAHFGADVEQWGLAGLLHDIDYEETKDDPARHSLLGGEMLEKWGVDPDVVHAVKAHNHRHGIPRESLMDQALFSADPVTGLIVAGALVRPEKRLAAVDVLFLINRMKEKSFARGANRDTIYACSEMGLELDAFLGISLDAMQGIHEALGL